MSQERYADKNGGAKPLNLTESIALLAYDAVRVQGLSLIECFIDEKRQEVLLNAFRAIKNGEKGTLSLSQIGRELFSNYAVHVRGLETLPQNGPVILAANHYNRGDCRGMWQIPVLTYILESNGHKAPSFIMDSTKPSIEGLPDFNTENARAKLQRYLFGANEISDRQISEKVSELGFTLGTLIDFLPLDQIPKISSRQILKSHIEHILHNVIRTANFIPTQSSGRQIVETVRNNGTISIFPTALDEYELKRGAEKSGKFFRLMTERYGVPIIPVGMWHSQSEKTYYMEIGKSVPLSSDMTDQEMADEVMLRVGLLLPSEMWGFYKDQLEDRETRLELMSKDLKNLRNQAA